MAIAKDRAYLGLLQMPQTPRPETSERGSPVVVLEPSPIGIQQDELVLDVRFSNKKSLKLQQKYLTPAWRQAAAEKDLQDIDSIALEFSLLIDESARSERFVQVILEAIADEAADAFFDRFKRSWSEQNERLPQRLKAEIVFASPDKRGSFRFFAVERLIGTESAGTETVARQYVVDAEHRLFAKLIYSSRLAPKRVFGALQAVLQGETF